MPFHAIIQRIIWKNVLSQCLIGGEDVEVIIVDDGSTKDDTAEIARQICQE